MIREESEKKVSMGIKHKFFLFALKWMVKCREYFCLILEIRWQCSVCRNTYSSLASDSACTSKIITKFKLFLVKDFYNAPYSSVQ
jgi:hypothetical protein